MKAILLICAVLIFSFCNAQQNGDNTIKVYGVTFLEACNKLLDSGYTIDKKDNDLKVASTVRKSFPRYWNFDYFFNVRVVDSVAIFTGKCIEAFVMPPFTSTTGYTIEYMTNKKGKVMNKAAYCIPFLILNDFVKCFGKKIEYSKQ